jgi:hypothetical protein
MTANVYRDPATIRSVMSAEYKNAAETIFVPLMQRAGIMTISIKKVEVALATKTVPEVTYFCDMPAAMMAFSIMAQTPLAEMLSLFGIVKIEIQASDEERKSLKSTYEALVNVASQRGVDVDTAGSGDGGSNTEAKADVGKKEDKPDGSKPAEVAKCKSTRCRCRSPRKKAE